jgi:DHA2 family multidrug resistance protein-like MFS transporter
VITHPDPHPAHGSAPEGEPDPRRWKALWVICAAIFLSAIDMTIVNVALPNIADDLNADVNELQWVVEGFLLALASLLLVGGGIADRFGRKRVFLAGFTVFAISSLLAAVSESPIQLIGARILMGVSVACILPPALSLMAAIFPPRELPRAIAIWAGVAGLGLAAGPVIGGILIDISDWRWVFLVNVPVTIVAIPFGIRLLPESVRPGTPAIDLLGVALSTLALGGIAFALIEGVARGWLSPPVLLAAAVGLGALAIFCVLEIRFDEPLFDITVLGRPRVRAGALALMAIYGATMGMLFLLPQYLQYVQGHSALVAGLAMAPFGVGMAVSSPFARRLTAKYMPRKVMGFGLLAMASAFIPLCLLNENSPVIQVAIGVGIFGLADGITITPATTVVLDDLGAEKAGDASNVNQLGRQVGGVLGVAIIGSIFAGLYATGLDEKIRHLPKASRDLANDSIEGAQTVAGKLDGRMGSALLDNAYSAFDSAARIGLGVCALFLIAAAAVALLSARSSPNS